MDNIRNNKKEPASVSLGHFGNSAVFYGLGNSVQRGAAFLVVPVYAHCLSISEYGTLEIALITVQIIVIFMTVGMPAAIIRFYSKAAKDGDTGRLLGSSLGVVIVAMLLCSIIILLLPSFISSKILGVINPATLVFLVVVSSLAECWTSNAVSIFRAQDNANKYALTAVSIGSLLILFTFFLLPLLNLGLSGALSARGLAYSSVALIVTYPLLRFHSLKFSIEKAREVFRFGFPLTISSFGWFFLLSSDRYFLGYFSGMHQVGIYSLGCRVTILLLVLVVWPFELAYGPFVFANMDHRGTRKMMSRLFTYLLLALIVVSYLIAVFSQVIIHLIAPKEFESAYKITICMLPTAALQGVYYWSNAQLHITNKTHHIALVIGISAFFNIIMNYLLIPKYGWVGAVLATNTSVLLAVGTLVVIGYYAFPVTLERRRLFILAVLGASLCFAYLVTYSLLSNYFYLVNSIVALAIPIFLYWMSFFDSNECQFITKRLTFKGP